MNAPVHPLQFERTVQVGSIRHRLAIGVQWVDALARQPAGGVLVSELEGIGPRALRRRFDLHPLGRHALRWEGPISRILAIGAAEKAAVPPANPTDDPTNFALRCFAPGNASEGYSPLRDPRRYVPRRVSLTPAQSGGVPPVAPDNVRLAWLWPGAGYPLPAGATAIRGRIRRGATLASAEPVPWARVVVTQPASPPDFAAELQIGWGHGDDRGEFLVVLGAAAVPGGATLPPAMTLRIWVFLPPATLSDAADPLAALPLEQGGSERINDVLRGVEPPPGYLRQAPADIAIAPGQAAVVSDAMLLFS